MGKRCIILRTFRPRPTLATTALVLVAGAVAAPSFAAPPRFTIPKGPVAQPTVFRPAPTVVPPAPAPAPAPSIVVIGPPGQQATLKMIEPPTRATTRILTKVPPTPKAKTSEIPTTALVTRVKRAPIAFEQLPPTFGRGGPALAKGAVFTLDHDGRKVGAGDYQLDSNDFERALRQRGVTQTKTEPTNSGVAPDGQKKKIWRLKAPHVPNQIPLPGSGPFATEVASTTLDVLPTAREVVKSNKVVKATGPGPEIARKEVGYPWSNNAGGSQFALVAATTTTFDAGPEWRRVEDVVTYNTVLFGMSFAIANIDARATSAAKHTNPLRVESVPGPATVKGTLKVFGIDVGGSQEQAPAKGPAHVASGSAWILTDAVHAGTTVPVGPFVVEFDVDAGYAVGAEMSGNVSADGLALDVTSGPVGKVWVEVRAGVGIAAFTAGVGGHLDLVGGAGGSGNGKWLVSSSSSYGSNPNQLAHAFKRSVVPKMFFLAGNFFVFAEALWERYDIELFDWNGLQMPDAPEAVVGDLWPIDHEPDYGALTELFNYSCFTGDGTWDNIASTYPNGHYQNCKLEGSFGFLVSNFTVGSIPVVECKRRVSNKRDDRYLVPITTLDPNVPGTLPPNAAQLTAACAPSGGVVENDFVRYALTANRPEGIKASTVNHKLSILSLCEDKKGQRYALPGCINGNPTYHGTPIFLAK